MKDIYYKKADGEIFKYVAGRMKMASCDQKYTKCDKNGKALAKKKKEPKK